LNLGTIALRSKEGFRLESDCVTIEERKDLDLEDDHGEKLGD
jgi:hypothetical protein